MKLKKIISAIIAAAVVMATSVNASANDEYRAVLGFADTVWVTQDWESDAMVTGDGQYTIESTRVAGATDLGVFIIDIKGMHDGRPEATAVLDKVEIDGKEVSFDSEGIICGDIEDNGDYRIEIFSQYGNTNIAPPIKQSTPVSSDLKVTFTVSGLGFEADIPSADASDSGTTSSDQSNSDISSSDSGDSDTSPDTATDVAPPSDAPSGTSTDSPASGNASGAVMLAVMILSGTVATFTRKKS